MSSVPSLKTFHQFITSHSFTTFFDNFFCRLEIAQKRIQIFALELCKAVTVYRVSLTAVLLCSFSNLKKPECLIYCSILITNSNTMWRHQKGTSEDVKLKLSSRPTCLGYLQVKEITVCVLYFPQMLEELKSCSIYSCVLPGGDKRTCLECNQQRHHLWRKILLTLCILQT